MRNWVVAFKADGPARLIDAKPPGARPRPNAEQRDLLMVLVKQGGHPPIAAWYAGVCATWLALVTHSVLTGGRANLLRPVRLNDVDPAKRKGLD